VGEGRELVAPPEGCQNSDSGLHLGFDTLQAPPLRFGTAVLSRLARLLPAQPPVALARASRRLAHPLSSLAAPRGPDDFPCISARPSLRTLRACLHPLLERLPAIHREALTLTELEGLTQVEAAARLGLSISGMKSRVQRARAELRKLLTACCEVDLDRRGDISGYTPRNGACDCRATIPLVPGV
jgi:predicted DNA-binding protein (UPF0251 family)